MSSDSSRRQEAEDVLGRPLHRPGSKLVWEKVGNDPAVLAAIGEANRLREEAITAIAAYLGAVTGIDTAANDAMDRFIEAQNRNRAE